MKDHIINRIINNSKALNKLQEKKSVFSASISEIKSLDDIYGVASEECKSEEGKEFESLIKITSSYDNLTYTKLLKLEKRNFIKTVLEYEGERIQISKKKIRKDKLKIAYTTLIMVLTHELSHTMRTRFATKQCYSNRTPVKYCNEAGLYIDRAIFGDHIEDSNLNPNRITLTIAEKVNNFQELTKEEAKSIYTFKNERSTTGEVCEHEEYIEDEDLEYPDNPFYRELGKSIILRVSSFEF